MRRESLFDLPAATAADLAPANRREFAGPPAFNVQLTQPIISLLAASGAVSVLDLGCGNGWFSAVLGRCGFDVTGADASEQRLQLARARHPDLSFVRHDVMDPWDGQQRRFDAVVAIDFVDHLVKPRRLFDAALAALAPGGLLVVTAPYHDYLKNLAIALSGRFDLRWQALESDGRLKFFSSATLMALMAEPGLVDLRLQRVGRIPALARSMIASGRAPG